MCPWQSVGKDVYDSTEYGREEEGGGRRKKTTTDERERRPKADVGGFTILINTASCLARGGKCEDIMRMAKIKKDSRRSRSSINFRGGILADVPMETRLQCTVKSF